MITVLLVRDPRQAGGMTRDEEFRNLLISNAMLIPVLLMRCRIKPGRTKG